VNLWEALSRKDVKDLTIVGNMMHPRMPAPPGLHLPTYGPIDCVEQPGKVKKIITGFTSNVYSALRWNADDFEKATEHIEVEPVTYGNLCTRLEAAACGYGGILTPVGVGTFLEDYCEKITVDGKEFILEKPLKPDFGFVKCWKADTLGNLVFYRGQRVHNPLVAGVAPSPSSKPSRSSNRRNSIRTRFTSPTSIVGSHRQGTEGRHGQLRVERGVQGTGARGRGGAAVRRRPDRRYQ
jgi:acyl CoA:acetate/3-ketoacid CoA transferase alpha subunit